MLEPGMEIDGLIIRTVTETDGGRSISMTVPTPGPFTEGHFPGNPVIPAFVQISWVERILEILGYHCGECVMLEQAKFLTILRGGEEITLSIVVTTPKSVKFGLVGSSGVISSGQIRFG